MAIKFDIAKAFDTMNLNFLHEVIIAFGFSEVQISWIKAILNYANIVVIINGQLSDTFNYSIGVRRGDPLSTLLFCLDENFLSRGFTKLLNEDKIKTKLAPKGITPPTHKLYADDLLFFCRGTLTNLKTIGKFFENYATLSR